MTDERYPSSSILSLAALLLSAITLLFASCGLLEVGSKSPPRPPAASAPKKSVDDAPAISPPRPTSTPWVSMATPAPTATPRVEGIATPYCPINVIDERYTRDNYAYPAMTIAATAKDAWIGFGPTGGGVWRYLDKTWQVFDQAGGFPISDTVQVLKAAPDGSVWAGAGCHLARYAGGAWEKTAGCDRLKGQVTDIAFTPDGATWVASALELSRFDGRAWTSYGKLAHFLAAGPDGALWVSGWEGRQASFYVARFDGEKWTTYPTREVMGHSVGKLAVTPDGALWGTTGEWGVVRFDGETWEHHTIADGLPGNQVTEIAVGPDGTLWARGNEGLAYFNGDHWLPVLHEGATGQGLLTVGPDGTVWLGTGIGQ
jgi:hypothetical protein